MSKEDLYHLLCRRCPGFEELTLGEIFERINLSEDQLKIARALDRDKVKYIRIALQAVIDLAHENGPDLSHFVNALKFLPTFEDEEK